MGEMPSFPIRKLLEQVYQGQVRIPAFQRGFVWDADSVAHFLDSIYKGYPFGSLLFWVTQEQLTSERHLGPYELPEAQKRYPISYVLDGQQRLTSLFITFQTELPRSGISEWRTETDQKWKDVYFDLRAPTNPQIPHFAALEQGDVEPSRHFPLSSLFDSVAYREASSQFTTEADIRAIDRLHSIFKEAQIPVQVMETEDRATVATVFERINHTGVTLSTLELLAAWTWSEDFNLRTRFSELQDELEGFGFDELAADPDLILRCAAAILTSTPNIEALMEMPGDEIRARFSEVENGIKGAIDFLRRQLRVSSLKTLPYQLMLVPLSVYFAVHPGRMRRTSESELEELKMWYWRSCFSERYSGQTVRSATTDIAKMQQLRQSGERGLASFVDVAITPPQFLHTSFRMGTARTATFVNLLAQKGPRSFISGSPVDTELVLQSYNKAEFHHIFPKRYLDKQPIPLHGFDYTNCLANFCFLSRADNSTIRARPPSKYRELMPADDAACAEILKAAHIDPSFFNDDYIAFLEKRSRALAQAAFDLMYPEGFALATERERMLPYLGWTEGMRYYTLDPRRSLDLTTLTPYGEIVATGPAVDIEAP